MKKGVSRRQFLQGAAAAGSMTVAPAAAGVVPEGWQDSLSSLLQSHYRRMSKEEVEEALRRVERRVKRRFGVDATCAATSPQEGVAFGYALNLSRCIGARRCVEACIQENNCPRDGHTQNIRVIAQPKGKLALEGGDHYFAPQTVPQPGQWYIPVQCQQCEDPPCVKACPVQATWKEKDGIVVIDYDWCIGCRYCAVACPYWARRFNWQEPQLKAEEINPQMHYLGNRPRTAGVMEKCTFCVQRTREGRQPACQEACPTGARIFGNLLDPKGELRYILTHMTVFRLKEELETNPNFWYFTDR
ncbi:MAG: 4Fe-4S dicluster domain-containing protein [Magnetococcales bacterium]|nr:4Fe-4S dicluster domain-containing protein [Magnetococcales bacterium]